MGPAPLIAGMTVAQATQESGRLLSRLGGGSGRAPSQSSRPGDFSMGSFPTKHWPKSRSRTQTAHAKRLDRKADARAYAKKNGSNQTAQMSRLRRDKASYGPRR